MWIALLSHICTPHEKAHLEAFGKFCLVNQFNETPSKQRLEAFAKGYNGPSYKQNKYDANWLLPIKNIAMNTMTNNTDLSKVFFLSEGNYCMDANPREILILEAPNVNLKTLEILTALLC